MGELSRRSKRKRIQSDTDENQQDHHDVDQDILSYEVNYSHEYDKDSISRRRIRELLTQGVISDKVTLKKKKVEDKVLNLCIKLKEKISKQHEKPYAERKECK